MLKSIFYKTTKLLLMLTIGLCLFSPSASAWKIDMHVWIAQQVLNDARKGSISIELDGRTRRIPLPDKVVRALRAHPTQFLIGSLGPDAFPDVTAGQLIIHPAVDGGWGTSEWLQHILVGELTDRERAFAMGYLTHAAADIFAHTFVNRYSGDVFEIIEHPDAAVRHVQIESLISNYLPPIRDGATGAVRSAADAIRPNGEVEFPEELVLNRLLMNAEALQQYELSGSAPHFVAVNNLHKTLNEFLAEGGLLETIEALAIKILAQIYLEIELSEEQSREIARFINQLNEELNKVSPDLVDIGQEVNGFLHDLGSVKYDAADFMIDEGLNAARELRNAKRELRNARDDLLRAAERLRELDVAGIKPFERHLGFNCLGVRFRGKCRGIEVDLGFEEVIPDPLKVAREAFDLADQAVDTLEGQISDLEETAADRMRDGLQLARDVHEFRRRTFDALIAFIGDQAFSPPHRKNFERWRDGIPTALVEFSRANAETIINSVDPAIKAARDAGDPDAPGTLDPMKEWLLCYGTVLLSAPVSATGAICEAIDDLQQIKRDWDEFLRKVAEFDPLLALSLDLKVELEWAINRLKNELLDQATGEVLKTLDSAANTPLFPLYKGLTAHIEVSDVNTVMSRDTSGQGLPIITDAGDRILAEMAVNEGSFDPEAFHAAYNAVLLSKLAMLDSSGLQKLASLGGVTDSVFGRGLYADGTPYSDNILFGFIRDIDGNHQWHDLAPPHPRNSDTGIEAEDFADRFTNPDLRFGKFDTGCVRQLGMRLWVDPVARKNLFEKMFRGRIAKGIDSPSELGGDFLPALPTSYPDLFDEGAKFMNDGLTFNRQMTRLNLRGQGTPGSTLEVELAGWAVTSTEFDTQGAVEHDFQVPTHLLPGLLAVIVNPDQRLETKFVFEATCGQISQTQSSRPSQIQVQKGNSLWRISEAYTGEGLRYPELLEVNKDKIEEPDLIYPGQELTIPWNSIFELSLAH